MYSKLESNEKWTTSTKPLHQSIILVYARLLCSSIQTMCFFVLQGVCQQQAYCTLQFISYNCKLLICPYWCCTQKREKNIFWTDFNTVLNMCANFPYKQKQDDLNAWSLFWRSITCKGNCKNLVMGFKVISQEYTLYQLCPTK